MNILKRGFSSVLIFWAILLLMMMPVLVNAQGPDTPSCGTEDDPFSTGSECPLDTWVILLALVVIIFAAVQLQRKQKSARV